MAARFSAVGQPYHGLVRIANGHPQWTGDVMFVKEHLEDPIHWKKPRMIFVNSMSDLFHEAIPDQWIDKICGVMACATQHIYQVLTKRPQRMAAYLRGRTVLPNVWWGTSVENQKTADERIPFVLSTPAAVRWVSYEPALGLVDFDGWVGRDVLGINDAWRGLDWIVVGGESGPGARPMDVAWARKTVKQCKEAGVAVFVKQLGANVETNGISGPGEGWPHSTGLYDTGRGNYRKHLVDSKGGDIEEWPEDLRVREYPNGTNPTKIK